jgi:hypothetical protein
MRMVNSGSRVCRSRKTGHTFITVRTMTSVSKMVAMMKMIYHCRNDSIEEQPVKGTVEGVMIAVARLYDMMPTKFTILSMQKKVATVMIGRERVHKARMRNIIVTTGKG